MARLDVYHLVNGHKGLVVDVQIKFLQGLASRVVVPLIALTDGPPPIRELNPVFTIEGRQCMLFTQQIAAVSVRDLGKIVMSLDSEHDAITRALDMLLISY